MALVPKAKDQLCPAISRGTLHDRNGYGSDEDREFEEHSRICQLAVRPVPKVWLVLSADLKDTERGSGGYGSTGITDKKKKRKRKRSKKKR